MKKYETIVIAKPTLVEKELTELVDKLKDTINQNGKSNEAEIWGLKQLAYPIKKFKQGYYIRITFRSDPEFVDELNRLYNITEDIIKHIIVTRD